MKDKQVTSLSERVYDTLKRQIIERELPPNMKLDNNVIAQQLGVSRMPVVDALTRLKAEGLIISRNRVGTYVTPLDRRMFEEIFEARDMIEQWATPKSITYLRDVDSIDLRRLLEKSRQLLVDVIDETFDYRKFREYDQQFHLALVRLCGNDHIIGLYESLNSHIQVARAYSLRALTRSKEGQSEHEAILRAFTNRDIEQARQAQHFHLQRSLEGILRLLEQRDVL
jgi:GntR family transcriptional regulator, rspAB operon transcriptional repressor